MHSDNPDYRVVDMSRIAVVKLHIRMRKLIENFVVGYIPMNRGKKSVFYTPYYIDNGLSE